MVFSPFKSHGLGQMIHGGLGGPVGEVVRDGDEGGLRGNVDDRSRPLLRDQLLGEDLAATDGRFDVDVDHTGREKQ